MAERRMKDEEIEALLRGQPRRRPSAELWGRVEVEGGVARPRRRARLVWVGAVAVVAVLGLWCGLKPAPQPAQRTKIATSRGPVVVQAPTPSAVRVTQLPAPPIVPKSQRVRVVPVKRVDRARAAVPTTHAGACRPALAKPAVVAEMGDESSYYLEVSHDGERSVLSGSVTRDPWQQVTQISISYESAGPADTKSVY